VILFSFVVLFCVVVYRVWHQFRRGGQRRQPFFASFFDPPSLAASAFALRYGATSRRDKPEFNAKAQRGKDAKGKT
jgi:hypothetical protein